MLFKGFYFFLFLILIIIYCAVNPIFQSASPCRLDIPVIGAILGIIASFIVTSLLLVVLSIIMKVPDLYMIRVEVILDSLAFVLFIAVYGILLAIGNPVPTNIALSIGAALYIMFNMIITGLVPALRTFKRYEELDVHLLDTWLNDDRLRGLFKNYCKYVFNNAN